MTALSGVAGRIPVAALIVFSIASGASAQEAAVDVTAGQMSPSFARPLGDMEPGRPDGEASPHRLPGVAPHPRPVSAIPAAPPLSLRPVPRDPWGAPPSRWDGHPRDTEWTMAVMAALRGPGAPLVEVVPRDIADWCPGYEAADESRRRAFWAGLVSVLAWHESTHRPTAVGGGGRWFGLVQIAPGTARWRNCEATTGQALLDGVANLRCGVRIMGVTVPRDRVVSRGMEGVAADWGPFHSRRKREDMRNWVRAQDYCRRPPPPAIRPRARPVLAAASAPMRPVVRPGRDG